MRSRGVAVGVSERFRRGHTGGPRSGTGRSEGLRVEGSEPSGFKSQRGPGGCQGSWVGAQGVPLVSQQGGVLGSVRWRRGAGGVTRGWGGGRADPHLLLVQHLLLELLHDLALLVDLVVLGGGREGPPRPAPGGRGRQRGSWGILGAARRSQGSWGAAGPGGCWEAWEVPKGAGEVPRGPSRSGGDLGGPRGRRVGSGGSAPCHPAACRACGSPPRTCGAPRPRCG